MLFVFGERTTRVAELERDWKERADLQDLASAVRFLRKHGVPFWVHGGWAVEALVGRELEHGDIDLLVPEEWRGRLRTILGDSLRFEHAHRFLVVHEGAVVEMAFLRKTMGRYRSITYQSTIWVYPEEDLQGHTCVLAGETCPVVSNALLYAEVTNLVLKKKKVIPKHQARAALVEPLLSDADKQRSRKLWPVVNTPVNRLKVRLGLWCHGTPLEMCPL